VGWVLTVAAAAVAVWIAFSIVIWATGEDSLRDDAPDDPPPGLGGDEPVTEEAVGALRFDTGMRGYRPAQVDAALRRLAWEIGRRDERIAELEGRAVAVTTAPESVEEAAEEDTPRAE
jgi:DivIVA domain-containing protein